MKKTLVLFFVLLLILAIAGAFIYFFAPQRGSDLSRENSYDRGEWPPVAKNGEPLDMEEFRRSQDVVSTALDLAQNAQYAESSAIFEEIARGENTDGKYTSEQVSTARRSTIFKYRITGDPADSLQSIEDLKTNILDPEVKDKHKARSLNTLATAHCWFARDPKVIEAIYGEEPFSKYWNGDPTQAVRDMLLWSYDGIYKTPKAAASLAYWHIDQILKSDYITPELEAVTRNLYIQEAKRYIKEADELAQRDLAENPDYLDRQRYVGYLYRRAFAIGGLAVLGEIPVSQYEDAFELLFKESDRQDNHNGSGFRPFAYILQAQFSQLLKQDDAIAQAFLSKAVAEIDADPLPQSNEVIDFIADKVYDKDGRFSWHAIQNMRAVSEEFDTFVTDVEIANK